MAWTDPSGHVFSTGEVVTASTLNTYVKDNLIDLDRRTTVSGASVLTVETTASTSYTNLATSGPAVTVTIGSTGRCMVGAFSGQANNTNTTSQFHSWAVSGASTIAANDDWGLSMSMASGTSPAFQLGNGSLLFTGLTAGSNTFTSKYKTSGGTATFSRRYLMVTPLGS